MAIRLEDDFGVSFQHQSTYTSPNSFLTVGPGSGAVFGGPIVKPQMTNMLSYSEDFSNATWIKSGAAVSNDVIIGPSGSMADLISWQSASGNVHQDGNSLNVISGMIYTFSVYLKGLTNGDTAHIGVGGDVFWKNDPIILTDTWQRYEVFGMHEKGPSGSVVRARIYPPAMSGVFAWGAQLEINPLASDYFASSTTPATRPIQYETDCVYVPRETSNYFKNNAPPTSASWSAAASSISPQSILSPLGRTTARQVSNSTNTNRILFTENVPASSVVSSISALLRPETSFGVYSFSSRQGPLNGFLYTNLCEGRTFQANSQNASGYVQNVGDGWSFVHHFSQNELAGGSRNEIGMTSYGRNNFSGTTLTPTNETLLFGGLWNSRSLGISPLTFNAGANGFVQEDILTTPIKSYNRDAGTIIVDTYIDWGIGIGTDAGKRTIFDASADSATTDRILLQKDTTANKYNYQLFGSSGQVVSGTVTLQLSIGWHRFAATWSSGSCDLWVDGTKRIDLGGINIGQVGTIRWGGDKFVTNEGFGAWMKNFYVYRTALSDSELTSLTGFGQTRYNAYRSEAIVNRTYQMWIDPNMFPGTFGDYTWRVPQAAGTGTVTSGVIDPFGGNGAYRIQAGNAPATNFKWQYFQGTTNTLNGVPITFTPSLQSKYFHNYYLPNTRSYVLNVWARANQLSPQPRFERNSPQGTTLRNITAAWTLLNFPATTPITVGSTVAPSVTVPVADQATGTIDVELFNPICDVTVGIYRETITPQSDDIPFSSGMIYKLKCAGNLNHGHTGTYESLFTDMGRNTEGTPYLGVDIADSIPDGSTIVYEYFAADSDTTTPVWKSTVEEINGRYFKLKMTMTSEDVELANPEVLSIRPRPRFS